MMIDKKKVLIFIIFQIIFCHTLIPHSGRTDSQGGHYNRRTGEYHFHHGYHAHDHPNGICPYMASGSKTQTSKINSSKNDSSYIIFLAIGFGFVLYYFMKYKNKKKYSNHPHKVFLKEVNDKNIENSNQNNRIENVTCPSCKRGFLILRHGRFGPFLGCSKFPNCRYTRSVK